MTHHRNIAAAALVVSLLLGGVSRAAEFSPSSPQPGTSELAAGLAVEYVFTYVRELSEIAGARFKGEPIADLTHRTRTGDVLTADRPMGVAAFIRGYIKLDPPGTYIFKVESNDGVDVAIGGQRIWRDDSVHPNRWSKPIEVSIDEPGWYDLSVDYFQRKGTSALQLHWTPPGGESGPVPASAFAHRP